MAPPPDPAAQERLKAALHYTTGKICTAEAQKNGLGCSKQFMAALTEVAYKQLEATARDVELFARHAKRSIISVDDVKLCARRNEAVERALEDIAARMARPKPAEEGGRPGSSKAASKGKSKVVHADESGDEEGDGGEPRKRRA